MPSKSLPVIQVKALVTGSPEFEVTRAALLEEFAANVPYELRLPPDLINNAPKNVTGIPQQCGLLSPEELSITEKYDATTLAALIAEKKLTSVAVATAFAKRAIIAHQLTSCLTEWFMDEAIERAKYLDEYLQSTGKTVGPLHGVPISIKEHMPIAGHWSSVGFLDGRVKDKEDSHMISILRAAGAVFYCKTNQPQAIMHLESTSLWGRVLNPHNTGLSAGGSTGGEAALLAMRGSVLGIGTDIGGSIRGPAGFCGIYGFKPTSYTLPMKDFLLGGAVAELNILISTGPMCSSLRDMDLFMSVILASKPHLLDPRLIPIPWTGLNSAPKPRPLKIGVMMNDGDIVPQPPVIRALKWASEKLEASGGFSVKPFEPYGAATAMKNIRLAYWPDGGRAVKGHLTATGEPMLPLTQWIIKDAEGPELKPIEVLQQRLDRDKFRCDFARHWESQDVDFVLCPVFVGPACEHETAFYWNYTAFWNYVDYPGCVFPTPIRAQKKSAEGYAADAPPPLSKGDEHVRKMWEDGDFEGAPITLQLVARKYHDNDLFAALEKMQWVLELP
ncbi:acetamidase [Trichoderma arundinaceum]|uniref:Acetamidase n=1 Tax=Trichoderma arundinaceum TaxID=490622 RepID=A0A395NTH9_TRIAR|nr:acetamidase [Trichoderma arundinaceum]